MRQYTYKFSGAKRACGFDFGGRWSRIVWLIARSFRMVLGVDLVVKVEQSSHSSYDTGDVVILSGWGVGEKQWEASLKRHELTGSPSRPIQPTGGHVNWHCWLHGELRGRVVVDVNR